MPLQSETRTRILGRQSRIVVCTADTTITWDPRFEGDLHVRLDPTGDRSDHEITIEIANDYLTTWNSMDHADEFSLYFSQHQEITSWNNSTGNGGGTIVWNIVGQATQLLVRHSFDLMPCLDPGTTTVFDFRVDKDGSPATTATSSRHLNLVDRRVYSWYTDYTRLSHKVTPDWSRLLDSMVADPVVFSSGGADLAQYYMSDPTDTLENPIFQVTDLGYSNSLLSRPHTHTRSTMNTHTTPTDVGPIWGADSNKVDRFIYAGTSSFNAIRYYNNSWTASTTSLTYGDDFIRFIRDVVWIVGDSRGNAIVSVSVNEGDTFTTIGPGVSGTITDAVYSYSTGKILMPDSGAPSPAVYELTVDIGGSHSVLSRPIGGAQHPSTLCYSAWWRTWVLITSGGSATMLTSPDGITWTSTGASVPGNCFNIAAVGPYFIIWKYNSTGGMFYCSEIPVSTTAWKRLVSSVSDGTNTYYPSKVSVLGNVLSVSCRNGTNDTVVLMQSKPTGSVWNPVNYSIPLQKTV